jgi:hypothetical protein
MGTRFVLIVRLIIVLVVLVLRCRLHPLGVGVALALVTAGGVVIRHVCRDDEFFQEDPDDVFLARRTATTGTKKSVPLRQVPFYLFARLRP